MKYKIYPQDKKKTILVDWRLREDMRIISMLKKDYLYYFVNQAISEWLEKPENAELLEKFNKNMI